MRKIGIIISLLLFGIVSAVSAQTSKVTGVITDSSGSGIARAFIRVRRGNGVIANDNGQFSISAKAGDTLAVSSIGYVSQNYVLTDLAGGGLTIVLKKQANGLEDVLVTTALGIRRTRNSLPYATQQVSGSDVTKSLTTDFVENLSGKVAGLQITAANTMGGSTNVILRGFKSLTGNNQALFVVDGVPYDNSNQNQNGFDLGNASSDINPADIESINVLKGAAASALYGSRAANGVIEITTKKAVHNQTLGITASVGVTVGSPDKSTLPTYQTQYGEGYGSQGSSPAEGTALPGFFYYQPIFNSNGQSELVAQTDVDAATGPAYNPSQLVYGWQSFTPDDPLFGKPYAWQASPNHNPSDFFVTPITNTASVFVNGGGDKATYKAGYTRSEDKGILPNSYLVKTLLTFGGSYDISDRVSVGSQLNYSVVNGINRDGYTYSSQGNPMMDFREWWPTDVNIKQQKADFFNSYNPATGLYTNYTWNIFSSDYTDPNATPSVAYHNNPYWNRYANGEGDERDRYFGNIHLNWKITQDLNFLARASTDNYTQLVEYHTAVGSVHTANYTRYNIGQGETNYDLLFNYNKNLSQDFNLKALLGGNVRQNNYSYIYATTDGGLIVPGLYALANSTNTPPAPVESQYKEEVDGIFAGATLSYRELLTLDGTVRRDKASTLPAANNTYYYPAISGNFVFSKLLPQLTWLSYGKLRANYAEVGNDALPYSITNTNQYATTFNSVPLMSAPIINNNPNLRPERSRSYEFGLEADFLQNRLGFDLTYYHARQIDQIMPSSVSTATGYFQYWINGGTVQNQGLELTVNGTPVKSRNFQWDITVNWSKNYNKVLSLYNGQSSYMIASYGFNTQLVAEVGKPYGIIRGSDYTYLNGQRVVDANGYYILNQNSLTDIGNINPNWIGGITNSFRYKNFTFSFLIDVRKGGSLYSEDMDWGDYSGLYPETAGLNSSGNPVRSPLSEGGGIILPGVTANGAKNTVAVDASDINAGDFPFGSYNDFANKSYVYDAGYIKLREVSLAYSLPNAVIEKLGVIKGIDISLSGRNLWIIHKNEPYADPEQGYGSGNASMGFQVGVYPTVRQLGLNAKVNF